MQIQIVVQSLADLGVTFGRGEIEYSRENVVFLKEKLLKYCPLGCQNILF